MVDGSATVVRVYTYEMSYEDGTGELIYELYDLQTKENISEKIESIDVM